MHVRAAQVRDHDELLHIIARSQLRCPALAEVSSRDGRPADYALAYLIRQQGPEDKVLVAQLANQLFGFMAVTSEVDISALQQNFELQSYDQLVQPEAYEAAMAKHLHRFQAAAEGSEAGATSADDATEVLATAAVNANPDRLVDMSLVATHPQELLDAVVKELQQSRTVPNAFAMTLLCCDPESQQKTAALALLAAAFEAFPDKDYCLLTLPADSPEVPLLSTFTRLPPPPGSTMVEVLYLCHRCALLDVQVQSGNRSHLEQVEELLSGVSDAPAISANYNTSLDTNGAYVACCQQQVVGVVLLQPLTDLSRLHQNFQTTKIPGLGPGRTADQPILQLTHFCLNPIFAHQAEHILLQILKRCKRNLLLYLLKPDQSPPDVLRAFRQVAPRHRLHRSLGIEARFALFALWDEVAARTPVNTHIVVVGASDCGLSVIESLMFHERLSFNAVTLVTPGGAQGSSGDGLYTTGPLAQLGLQAKITILDAELVSIDRQQQCIMLSNKIRVQYGLLVLTAGLQPSCSLAADQLTAIDSQQVCCLQNLRHRMPKDTAAVEKIIVHGAAFEACTAMQQLRAAGVDLAKVQHLASAAEETAISALLREAAGLAGLTLPSSEQVTDWSLQSGAAEGKVGVTYNTAAGQHSLQADLVVMASAGAVVPGRLVQAAGHSALVWDGRLVVDVAFRTTDPNILAAGTAAKFSRRYGEGLYHSLYSSQEVGQRAADSIVATFSSPFLADSALPRLRKGRLFTTAVPGGGVFAYVCAAGMQPPSSLDAQEGTSLVSRTQQGYFQLTVNASNVVQSALLCSSAQQDSPPEAMLLPLVGLPITYLHDLLHSYDTGKVPDVPDYLQQPWTALLYHDQFPQLRSALAQHVEVAQRPLQEIDGNSIDQGAVTFVQDGVIDFVKQQGPAEFPQYDVAAFVP